MNKKGEAKTVSVVDNTTPTTFAPLTDISDLKKFIPGEGSGKDFLRAEIERMIGILRKKQEMGDGIHIFRRVEPNAKLTSVQAQNVNSFGQSGRYEEVQF